MIHNNGQELLVVVGPRNAAHAIVELGSEVGLLAGGEVHNHQTLLVGFVAVALHTLPSDIFAIVREDGILVVTLDFLADVAALAGGDVIEVDVAVGRYGIVVAGLLAAGVGNGLAVGAVVVLLRAAPRTHRRLVGLAVEDILGVVHISLAVGEGDVVDVGNLVYPVVPVAIHQVLVDAAGGLVETFVELVDVVGTLDGNGRDVDHRLAVGSQLEAFKATLALGNDTLLLRIDIHRKNLAATAIHNGAFVHPHRAELALGGGGQTLGFAAFDGHHVQLGVVLVLLHIGVAHRVEHLFAVGTDGILAHHAEAPHHLGCETAVLDLDLWFLNDKLVVGFLLRAGTYECQRSNG